MSAYEVIENHQLVLEHFGQWPSFHDGEVHCLVLDRMRQHSNGSCYPSIELFVRGWIMTSEITEEGYYKLKHDSVVHFLFEEVGELELDGLNHQNVLSGLEFEKRLDEKSNANLCIELSHCFGLSGRFTAAKAKVVSVTPYAK